jgi:hypothetical protein
METGKLLKPLSQKGQGPKIRIVGPGPINLHEVTVKKY